MSAPAAPHIPPDNTPHARRTGMPYIFVIIAVSALTGFIAGLAYTAFGPSARPMIFPETRIERITAESVIDERRVHEAQESVLQLWGDRATQPVGFGTAITGDGWFVVSTATLSKTKRVILHPRAVGTVEKIVSDPASDFSFIKTTVRDARLLATADTTPLPRGSKLVLVTPTTATAVTLEDSRACITDRCPTEYADRVSFGATLVEPLAQKIVDGAPVVTTRGELFGIAQRRNGVVTVIPLASMRTSYESAFTKLTAGRPLFPVRVINATRFSVLNTKKDALIQRGFFVEQSAIASLRAGDIITHVDRRLVEAQSTLFDFISSASSVGSVTLTVERAGATRDIVVKFKSL